MFQASRCIHSDTVACLVDTGEMRKKKKRRDFGGFNNVAFQWSHDMKHKKRKSGENRTSAGLKKKPFLGR